MRLFCQALRDAAREGGEAAPDEEVPPDVLRVCRRGERLRAVARQEAGNLRGEADACAGEMFRQAERILGELARTRVRPREPPRLDFCWGASARSFEPGAPSGDAHLLRRLPDGRMLALICDGMGTGEAAREESERAARLIWRFLAAGVEPEAALKAANALLVRRWDGRHVRHRRSVHTRRARGGRRASGNWRPAVRCWRAEGRCAPSRAAGCRWACSKA